MLPSLARRYVASPVQRALSSAFPPAMLQSALSQEADALRRRIAEATPRNPAAAGFKTYSQTDEDGILQEIFARIGEGERTFAEMGCGNGLENNTHLLLLKGWRGVWIDGDPKRIEFMAAHFPLATSRLTVLEAFVTRENVVDLVTRGLGGVGADATALDLLSLDLDGNDLEILSALLATGEPRVLCLEYNAKFRPPVEAAVTYDPAHVWAEDDYHGASLASILRRISDRYTLRVVQRRRGQCVLRAQRPRCAVRRLFPGGALPAAAPSSGVPHGRARRVAEVPRGVPSRRRFLAQVDSAPVSVAAVVVAWRAGKRAGACLGRLAEVAPGVRRVLVDNEAGDDSSIEVPEGTAVVRLADNLGFAGGANEGIARAFADGAQQVVLLNDDVLVEAGCVEALAEAAGATGAASPRIEGPPGIAFAGGELELVRGFGRHVDGARDYLSGACLCISRGAWNAVGPFNDQLFLYYEDVEWCLRARSLGVPLTVVLDARATHSGGASSGGAEGETWAYYSTRNRLWLLEVERGARVAAREAAKTRLRARMRTVQPARRAVARAKLAGVLDWSERRMGRGPWPR